MTRFPLPFFAADRRRALGAALVSAALLAACGGPPPMPQMPPPEVGVLQIAQAPMPLELEYAARIRGVREVEVRARVSGILLEKRYREGAAVKAGDVLFRIDPAPFRAAAAQARAQLGVQRAALEQATRERDRIVPLYDQNAVSRRDRDAALANYDSARAAVDAAEAALRTAELDLSYTDVRAPIAGLTGREMRSEGSLVTAGSDSSLLTHIVQADRLYVEFAMPADEAVHVRRALAGAERNAVGVDVVSPQGTTLARGARIEFVAPSIGDETGTVAARALVDNRDGGLLAGQVARARVTGVALAGGIVVPKRAVLRGQQGAFVWVVGGDGKVQPRPVKLGISSGNLVVADEGLAAGDRVVVDGILKVQPGAPAKPVLVAADGSPLAPTQPAGPTPGRPAESVKTAAATGSAPESAP